ncbi:MAG: TlpA disulfide reductase family protein [Bacteroidota bacterium]
MQKNLLAGVLLLGLVVLPISAVWILHGEFTNRSPAPGTRIPSLILSTRDGSTFALGDFIGKRGLIFFFTVECSHCRKEFSNLTSLYPQYAKDLRFFFVSLSEVADTRVFLGINESTRPVFYYNSRNAGNAIDLSLVPTLYLVDEGLILRSKYVGERSLEGDKQIIEEFIHDSAR